VHLQLLDLARAVDVVRDGVAPGVRVRSDEVPPETAQLLLQFGVKLARERHVARAAAAACGASARAGAQWGGALVADDGRDVDVEAAAACVTCVCVCVCVCV